MKTFAIVGCGHLGKIVKNAYEKGFLSGYELVAAYSRKPEDSRNLVEGTDAIAADSVYDIIKLKPDYIIETASIELLKEFALTALSSGISIIPLSIGAFADQDFKMKAISAAENSGAKVLIPSGAVGGFDAISTIALMAEAEGWDIKAGIHTHKGPDSLKNTPLYDESLQNHVKTVFKGSTKEAISLLPTKVNVAVASSLAAIGPDKTNAEITSVPGFIGDDHRVTIETEGLKAVADIYSAKSDIAAWSAVALMRNLSSPMMFF